MNRTFYPKLAISNIVKNKKTYFPYILTCMFTIMMYYMMSSIIYNKNFKDIYQAGNLMELLKIAITVTIIFSVIFLFYTNSFLMKRRRKEIGLFNILGMEKRHIAKMMIYETLFIAITSLLGGFFLGIVFSKIIFLFLLKLISFQVVLGFDIPVKAVTSTLLLFSIIFAVTLLYNLGKVHLTKPIELLHGGQIGEKEPKTKIIMTLIGLGTTGWGYWFALTTESPLKALVLFFLAVILVVIGTYALFTAGSIALLKLLRRNKNYYYKIKHFTNISGMLYRMKQNAVGLANICILSTMVVIMISTTISLYAGTNAALANRYPRDIDVTAKLENTEQKQIVDEKIQELINERGIKTNDYMKICSINIFGQLSGQNVNLPSSEEMRNLMDASLDDCMGFEILSASCYKEATGEDLALQEGEIALYSSENLSNIDHLNFTFPDGENMNFSVKHSGKKVNEKLSNSYEKMLKYYYVVVQDDALIDEMNRHSSLEEISDTADNAIEYNYNFNAVGTDEQIRELSDVIYKLQIDGVYLMSENAIDGAQDFYGMYGGFMFIGIFLGILFMMATVLIIYYKQISEGYEDKERFEIMQKVGMSHAEIKKTIHSQVLMVFFLPIAVTALHIAISFRIIKQLLAILGLMDVNLFVFCTVMTLLAFCTVYGIVFLMTAKSYYRIVSTAER